MIRGRQIAIAPFGNSVRKSRRTIWMVALIILIFSIWAANAPLDEIVRGVGRIVPTMKNQVVQNLEGGIIDEIFVTEGDVVDVGQLVVKMDEILFQSAYQELQDQRLALLLRLARLRAEQNILDSFEPGPELTRQAPEYTASEVQIFEARRAELSSTLENMQNAVDLKTREVAILRPMVERSAVPEIDLIQAEQEAIEVRSRLSAVATEFETARSQEHSEVLLNFRQVEEQIRTREDQLDRTNVKSPVHGVVNDVLATTIGGVVQPGDPLVEILSLDDELRVEGRIAPRDIGFVFVGMPAIVKLTAYDFSIYGMLEGQVAHVGADTVVDKTQSDAEPYYEVYIELYDTALEGPEGPVEIRPGMQAGIELQSGQRTVLQYILKPIFKTTEAFTER